MEIGSENIEHRRSHPSHLTLAGTLTELYGLNIDGGTMNGIASRGGVIGRWDREHFSNIYSFNGMDTNNYTEIKALLEGIFYCQILGINDFQIQCDSLPVINGLDQEDLAY